MNQLTYIPLAILILVVFPFLLAPTKNSKVKIVNSVFVQVILGFEHKSPHGIAHHWVLMIGFVIEATILYSSVSRVLDPTLLNRTLVFLIIFNLIYHQILIYRNFTVAEHQELEHQGLEEADTRKTGKFALLAVTFFIFVGISAVAGEFGYLFAVSKLSHIGENGSVISHIIDLMDAKPEKIASRFNHELPVEGHEEILVLKYSLKSIFVFGAGMVCFLVLVWDFLIKYLPNEFQKFKDVWWFFIFMDFLSLSIWIVVSSFVIPSADYISSPDARDLLLALVLLYSIATAWRTLTGYTSLRRWDGHTTSLAL